MSETWIEVQIEATAEAAELVAAAVDEAARGGAFVTAHARGPEPVMLCVRHGGRIIHPATHLDDHAHAALPAAPDAPTPAPTESRKTAKEKIGRAGAGPTSPRRAAPGAPAPAPRRPSRSSVAWAARRPQEPMYRPTMDPSSRSAAAPSTSSR